MLKALEKKPKKRTLINLEVKPEESAAIEQKAKKYAGGNVSAWLRYAGMNMVPNKSELVKKKG